MSTWKKIIISGSDAILNSVTASNGYFGTASFAINASTASFLSGTVVSASYATTASYVLNAVSASFATSATSATSASFASTSATASFVNTLTQNVTISGSVYVSGSVENVDYIKFGANASSPASLSTGIFSVGSNIMVTGSSIDLYTNSGTVRISGTLVVNSGSITATNGIIATGSILVNGIVNATSFTGSLQGTATSASFASTASYWGGTATSASFASTSSFVNTLTQNVTVSGSIFLSGSLNTPVFVDYEERFSTPGISIAPSPGELILNLANGNVFDVALNANITTLTISNPPAANNAGSFVLIFTADGNPRVVSWGASILWPAGTAPTLTSTNGKKDVFGFISLNSGTNFMGFIGGQNI